MGAGLLAKAVYQDQTCWLTLRFREQARSHTDPSHMGIAVFFSFSPLLQG